MKSKLWFVDAKDLFNSAITAVGGAVTGAVYSLIQNKINSQDFTITRKDLTVIGFFALGAFFGYLQKRFVSDEAGKTLGKF